MILDDCAEFTAPLEGCMLTPYKDSVGVATIGYGHTEGVTMDASAISLAQAKEWLKNDLSHAYRALLRLTKVPLNPNQQIALIDFIFNLGAGAYQRSTLRQMINRGDFDCESEFLKWSRAGGRVLKGLLRRRQAEAALFAATSATNMRSTATALTS